MKLTTFKRIQAAVAAVIGIGVAIGVMQDNLYLVVAAVLAGVGVMYVSTRRVTEKIADEMAYRMAEKASYRAFQIFTVAAAAIAIVSMATNWLSWLTGSDVAGQTLAYSAVGLLALYALFYSYYERKGLK